ncbi:MAG: hypothetical protein DCF25_20545 [Leptolyngbya foveolarum]|uniref:Uncharacterized protein n=1 Tax=Leptolyngbya foveolarum TaxID=47253 RepID=A0A2W4TNZ8_9CYAN|nr:MAG: hypothetical protein DCF25_20545 [Leptolyngbya foveolarum]
MKRSEKQHTSQPCSIQAVSDQAGSILAERLSGRGFTFIGMWLVLSNGIENSLGTDSLAYQNRLEPINIRSGKCERLAVIPS